MLKKSLKYVGWALGIVIVLALVAYAIAYRTAMSRYERTWTVHAVEFPIPFPLSEDEIAALRADRIAAGSPATDPLAGVDLNGLALERAIARGKRLVDSRIGCNGCHGQDFGGRLIIDISIVGHWVAPNLTTGIGSRTRGYTSSDWDRAVRHAVRKTGQSSSMPSEEFVNLSDHELSDVVAYIRSMPPVDRDLGPVRIGPVFAFLTATDPKTLPAFYIEHDKPHAVEPPASTVPSVELGQHISQVCRGCHGPTLSGGKVAGDPNMPIVANITPHETGLKGWTEADFFRALREGRRKDGTAIVEQMPWRAYGQMSDTELKGLWAYLQTVPAIEKGNH
jgi:mono/diheme cytochrome c family protein